MAARDANLSPSAEKANGLRLVFLLVEGGTLVLRYLLESNYKPKHPTLKHFLAHNKKEVKRLVSKQIIRQSQNDELLYPAHRDPDCGQFDISLLTILLNKLCGYRLPARPPNDNDLTIGDDIGRLRNLRNELSHNPQLGIDDGAFIQKWNRVKKVLMRLGGGIPDLGGKIDNLRTRSIDPGLEASYRHLLASWEKMDERMLQLADEFSQLNEKVDALDHTVKHELKRSEITPRLQELIDNSQQYFEDHPAQNDVYVKTKQYMKAVELFQKEKILILTGSPGEGKTSMALEILHEVCDISRCLRLRRPDEWTAVESKTDKFDTIFIDDIFGAGMLDEDLLKLWNTFMKDIFAACQKRSLKVIITTRHYILKDAKPKLKRMKVFDDDHVHELSSEALTSNEKSTIFVNHLKGKYQYRDTEVAKLMGYLTDFYQYDIVDTHMFGFPECVKLFANNARLRKEGVEFFRNPKKFAKSCIEDIFVNDEEKFLPFILMWAAETRSIDLDDLNPANILEKFHEIADDFGHSLDTTKIRMMKNVLENHNGGFIELEPRTRRYVFSHNVVHDMVGVVLGQHDSKPVLKYAHREFLHRYVTVDPMKKEEEVFIEEIHHKDLAHALLKTRYSMLDHGAFTNVNFAKYFVQVCIEKGIDVSEPLMVVDGFRAYYHHFFQYHGLDVKAKYNNLALSLAVKLLSKGRPAVFEEFILNQKKMGESYSFDMSFDLLIAIDRENIDAVDFILKHGGKVTLDALYVAVKKRSPSILQRLLEERPKFSPEVYKPTYGEIVKENSPLMAASKAGYIECVKLLVKHGMDLEYRNVDFNSALDKAVTNKRLDVVSYLIKQGAQMNVKSGKFHRTPFHVACDIGLSECVKLMLTWGADVYTTDKKGYMPIHSATLEGHTEVVKLLLQHDVQQAQHKASPYNKKSPIKGMNLLHIATWKKSPGIVKILLGYDVDPNERDFQQRTGLHYAVFGGNLEIVKSLLDLVDVNAVDRKGQTPLHVAVQKRNFQTAKLVCTQQSVNSPDKTGKTPLHLTCELKNLELALFMIKHYKADMSMVTKCSKTIFDLLREADRHDSKSTRSRLQRLVAAGESQHKGQWCQEQFDRVFQLSSN